MMPSTTESTKATGVLVFECPATGRPFRSDIHTDADSLDRVRHLHARVRCPICNEEHDLSVKQSEVDDKAF